eukprot:COSAG01_NODE_1576_length_9855_cov_32.477962_3_plen_102_part_00
MAPPNIDRGDNSSCWDACFVPWGDNSTCWDACFVPWGDNTTCAGCDGALAAIVPLPACGADSQSASGGRAPPRPECRDGCLNDATCPPFTSHGAAIRQPFA